MKETYEHRYNKVTVPMYANTHELEDFMTSSDYSAISGLVDMIGYTVTVEDDPEDGYQIVDWDIMPLGDLILFGREVLDAVELFVDSMESEIVESDAVKRAFDSFYAERVLALASANMDKYYNVVSR